MCLSVSCRSVYDDPSIHQTRTSNILTWHNYNCSLCGTRLCDLLYMLCVYVVGPWQNQFFKKRIVFMPIIHEKSLISILNAFDALNRTYVASVRSFETNNILLAHNLKHFARKVVSVVTCMSRDRSKKTRSGQSSSYQRSLLCKKCVCVYVFVCVMVIKIKMNDNNYIESMQSASCRSWKKSRLFVTFFALHRFFLFSLSTSCADHSLTDVAKWFVL